MKIYCTTGERAVHLSLSYDDAEELLILVKTGAAGVAVQVDSEAHRILSQIAQARKRGYPKPPLKKSNE